MNLKEYNKMVETGRLQEGLNGLTRVAYPASPDAYRAAPKGDYYVEFDISKAALSPSGQENWRAVRGPNSSRAKIGKALPEFPEIFNISRVEVR